MVVGPSFLCSFMSPVHTALFLSLLKELKLELSLKTCQELLTYKEEAPTCNLEHPKIQRAPCLCGVHGLWDGASWFPELAEVLNRGEKASVSENSVGKILHRLREG